MNTLCKNLFTPDLLSKEKKPLIASTSLIYAERTHDVAVLMRTDSLDRDKLNFGSYYSAALSILNQMTMVISMIKPLVPEVAITMDLDWLKLHADDAVLEQDWYKLSACTETVLNICKELKDKLK